MSKESQNWSLKWFFWRNMFFLTCFNFPCKARNKQLSQNFSRKFFLCNFLLFCFCVFSFCQTSCTSKHGPVTQIWLFLFWLLQSVLEITFTPSLPQRFQGFNDFFKSAFLRYCFLCWDRWNGDVTPALDVALLYSSRAGSDLGHLSGLVLGAFII